MIRFRTLQTILLGFILSCSLNSHSMANTNATYLWWSTNNPSFVDQTNNVIVYDSGNYNFDGSHNNPDNKFTTNRQCPAYYTPYFVVIINKTWGGDSSGCFSLEMSSYSLNGSSSYDGHFFHTYNGDSGGVAFTWVMYCYPPGVSVPGYLSTSNSGNACG